uniref:Uncharacterized protein n=1 Tax=Globodera rostochiensis TaxID=31243 RepID=A0A914HNL7_GLORO
MNSALPTFARFWLTGPFVVVSYTQPARLNWPPDSTGQTQPARLNWPRLNRPDSNGPLPVLTPPIDCVQFLRVPGLFG